MSSPARHLAIPAPSSSKTNSTRKALSTDTGTRATRKTRNPARTFLGSAALLVAVVALALVGTGSTYAMWNKTTAVNASTVASASTGLTINGSASYTIPALSLTKLGPGQSVMVPLTLANTGTIKVSAAVTGVTISSDTKSLAAELTLRATQSATCVASGATGTHLASFATTAAPITLAVGASAPLCLEFKMDVDAPMTVAGSSTSFTLNLTATQVRGA